MGQRGFRTVRFIAAERSVAELEEVAPLVAFAPGEAPDLPALAQRYLERVLAQDADLSFGTDAAPAPELAMAGVQASRLSGTELVRFAQASASIPIFGSHMLVELRGDGGLVGVEAELAAVQGVSATPTLGPEQAAASVAALAGVASIAITTPPTLTYYHDEEAGDRWRLAWFFRDVAAAPVQEEHAGRGHGGSPRRRTQRYDYLVDAHDGEVCLDYSTTPHARAEPPAIPIQCRGRDDDGAAQEFHAVAAGDQFELRDPLRKLSTYDLAGGDISRSTRLPATPIRSAVADLGEAHPAAVSAHVNVGRVLDFYRSVLMRDSVDDRGMEIVSVVRCISSDDEAPPNWGNAIWWKGHMWYGQVVGSEGRVRSFSGFLDVIGHELTHGVIEHSAALIYKGESGALNESFCDILGVIIGNWYRLGEGADVETWSWEFGPGLGDAGKPIRDLRDPGRTGDPKHMDEYLRTRQDDGGVHSNSNIHNKAAYHLITAEDPKGRVFTAREAAMLYYLCLIRLPQRATFRRVLRGLLDVAGVYFSGDAVGRERKLRAIERAYAKVGISVE